MKPIGMIIKVFQIGIHNKAKDAVEDVGFMKTE
jgi:hypothetical protein